MVVEKNIDEYSSSFLFCNSPLTVLYRLLGGGEGEGKSSWTRFTATTTTVTTTYRRSSSPFQLMGIEAHTVDS